MPVPSSNLVGSSELFQSPRPPHSPPLIELLFPFRLSDTYSVPEVLRWLFLTRSPLKPPEKAKIQSSFNKAQLFLCPQ